MDASNIDRLQRLTGPLHRYTATNHGDQTKLKGCMAPEELELKLDAQVMLIKNLTPSLVNGSTGIVIGFTHEGKFTSENSLKSRMLDKDWSKGGLGRKEPTPVPTEVYPIVRFVTGEEVVIQPEKWEVEIPGKQCENVTSRKFWDKMFMSDVVVCVRSSFTSGIKNTNSSHACLGIIHT